jgi:serine/threonine protein kinase
MINPDIYNIKNSLGQGGMAEVFLAEDLRFHSNVAIKILNKELTHNSNISQRFIAEARNLFRLSHPNIVRVVDLIDTPDLKAFVMDFIEGESLKAVIERGNISKENLNLWLNQMLDALGYCHQNGLIHRDIKPSNFMVDKHGNIKLLDFGIAKNLNNGGEYTQTGTAQMLGTPIYMSPEQVLETKTVDELSDIYSFGVVLWQMLSGQKPYDSTTLSTFQIQSKIVNEPLPLLNSEMDGIIQKCTDKVPKNRFINCTEIKKALLNPKQITTTAQDASHVNESITNSNKKTDLGSDKTRIEQTGPQIQTSKAGVVSNPAHGNVSTPPNTTPPIQSGSQNAATPPPNKKKSKLSLIPFIGLGLLLLISGGLYYFQEYEPKHRDSDHDGWVDVRDDCPYVYSLLNRGCPDSDNDGVLDKDDKCAFEKGLVECEGCPDSDGDLVGDHVDVCPDLYGTSGDGCPIQGKKTFYLDSNQSSFWPGNITLRIYQDGYLVDEGTITNWISYDPDCDDVNSLTFNLNPGTYTWDAISTDGLTWYGDSFEVYENGCSNQGLSITY